VERHVDLVIIARGGGSAEDLAAFNNEARARAIVSCRVPVVSAIGHEVDFTIADFVADARAPTPSGAAELVVPSFAEVEHRLSEAQKRLMRGGQRVIAEARLRVDAARDRAQQSLRALLARRRRALDDCSRRLASLHPRARLHRDRAALMDLERRLEACMHKALQRRRRDFGVAVGTLQALSPLAVLERGYSLVRTPEGALVRDAGQVAPGQHVDVKLSRGRLDCVVQSTDPGRRHEGDEE
jgi:exodeoxyribonuclease VII large subunit